MRTMTLRAVVVLAVIAPLAAQAADETHLGATVGNVAITKPIPAANLSLRNVAATKTVAAHDLAVSGADPTFTVTGQVFCKNGARLVSAQAIIGQLGLNNGQLISVAPYGKSPEDTSVANRTAADISIPVKLPVTRKASDAALDLTFNPARTFEDKLKSFAGKGGSAATYLKEDQAFDMPVKISLVGLCKMPANADSVLAGKTYAGFATRIVPVTILYTGDAAIVPGPAPRATTTTSSGGSGPPARTTPPAPKRAP
jgi:hypothetical protein